MHIPMEEVAATFMIGQLLFVVAKNGTIWKFNGFNTWSQVAYLPTTP